MKTVIDLYDYFKIAKPDGARAELTCYLLDNSIEINNNINENNIWSIFNLLRYILWFFIIL